MIEFLTEHNYYTLYLLILSTAIDIWAAKRVDDHVHDPSLYSILSVIIITNLSANWICFLKMSLFNILPICSLITIILLCKVLVDRNEKKNEIFDEVIKNLIKTQKGKKKELCKHHYTKVVTQDLKGACSDCPLLE